MRNGIVVIVEGLNSSLVGAYGSNTAVTPNIDLLAAHGLVFDFCFVDSLDRKQQLASLWTGMHSLLADSMPGWESAALPNEQVSPGLFALLNTLGYSVRLLTDCKITAEQAEVHGCQEVILIAPPENPTAPEHWSETAIANVFAAAIEELAACPSTSSEPAEVSLAPQLLIIHSRGLRLPWDAPAELRNRFTDPEDPEPPTEVCVPKIYITEQTDPDEVIGWAQVAAAQAAIVDASLGSLISAIADRNDANRWAWMFVSPGGVSLGEHKIVGWDDIGLYGEQLQCIAVATQNLDTPIGDRRSQICQISDLLPTLLEMIEVPLPPNANYWGVSQLTDTDPAYLDSSEDSELSKGNGRIALAYSQRHQRWIRTPAWSAIIDGDFVQLFVKPDDRWEVSDIASRRPDIADQLKLIAEQMERAILARDRRLLPTLDFELCNLLR